MRRSPLAQIDVPDKITRYLRDIELLHKKREESSLKKIPVIEDDVGYFLSMVCILNQPEEILEIGCGTGYSTYFLLKDLDYEFTYTGIDLNKKRISEAESFIKGVFKENEYFSGKIKFIHGNAISIIPELDLKFDLVFIDAAKLEYLDYIKSVKEKLNRSAIVIADNIFYKNKVFDKAISKHDYNTVSGLRGYIDFIIRNPLFENYFFNTGDGIVLSKYRAAE